MKQIMKKKSKTVKSVTLVFLAVIICFSLTMIHKLSIPKDIDSILESEYYSYLPIEAKNYLRAYYEETGDILLTEKNKEENTPYLNPQYVEYISSSTDEQSEYGYIPSNTIVDYVYGTNTIENELPEKFDLRNVNGKNFVTPVQAQFGGLCWAYSSTAQIEGLLLIENDVSYSSDATIFSERQLDYATSKNGIAGGKTLYPYRLLYDDGGAYSWPWDVEVDGLGLVDISWQNGIEESVEPLEAHRVYNFNNSLYEVDSTINMPSLNLKELDETSETDIALREEYLNTIKQIVQNYGGAVAGSIDPTGKCSISSGDTRLIYNNNKCITGGGHAMQIIGWDDNYEYSFCESSNSISGDVSSCSSENLVTGKGVWILKNSWGENLYPYLYLAYDNYNLTISAVTSVDVKEWDNYYYSTATSGNVVAPFTKNINSNEKIEKIKIKLLNSNVLNDKLDIYLSLSDDEYELVDSIDTSLPGYYTVDLSDKNLISSEETIKLKAKYGNSHLSFTGGDSVRIYTSNVDDETYIETEDYTYNSKYTNQSDYEIRVNQITKGIPDGEEVTYKILDSDGVEINVDYSYTENIVFANNIFPKISIDSTLELGEYTLQTIYNDVVKSSSKLIILGTPVEIEGTGSKNDPYIITNSMQLNLMRNERFAYYQLGKDIDLTYDTQNENGLFYNDGLGWEPIDYMGSTSSQEQFAGSFDGKGFKIKGLYINRPNEDYVGLFRKIYSYGTSEGKEIKLSNLILESPRIIGNNYVGGLAGEINAQSNIYLAELDNLYVIGGSIKGNNYVGGLAGSFKAGVYYDSQAGRIHSLFNSSSVTSIDYAGGIFGHVESGHPTSSGMKMFINNIINIGTVSSDGNASGLVGNIKMLNGNPISIENAISIGDVVGENCSSGISCELDSNSNGTVNLKNIYYLTSYGYDETNSKISANNISKMNLFEINNSDNYGDWNNFETYWNVEIIDNVNRTPILKNMDISYLSSTIDKIVLSKNDTIDIIDTFNGDYNFDFYIENTEIAEESSAIITGKNIGKTYLNVSSVYEKLSIPIYVTSSEEYTISFDANGGTGTMSNQKTILQNDVKLNKNEFVKEGYKFKEWNTEADGTGISYTNEQKVLDMLNEELNVILYAQWEPITYKIVFNSNDETNKTEEQIFTYDVEQTLLSNPLGNTEFSFLQWNTEADGTGTSYTEEQNVINLATEDNAIINLYAIWESYTISFDANGGTLIGTEPMEDIIVKVSDYMVTSVPYSKFKKEGYRMASWNTEPDGSGKRYLAGGVITPTSDTILYAQWEAKQYNVKYYYKLNNIVGTIKTVLFTYDTETELLDAQPDEEGYKFVYWGTKADGTGTNYLPKQKVKNLSTGSEVTLYTIFSPITYKVVFNSNDGTNQTEEQTFTYDVEQLLKTNTYTKEGYKFKEWNTEADGTGTPYTDEQNIKNLATEDNTIINLYAIWEKQAYSVTFDANEGIFTDNKTTIVIENWDDSKLDSLEKPTKEGYTFKGYYTEKTGGTSLENYIAEAGIDTDGLVFYAQWEVNKYTLKFDANSGTGTMNNQEFIYDTLQKITKNTFTKEGYKFKEWNTEADGTGTSYTDEKEIKLSENLTLYAIWEETYSYIINKYSYDDSKKYIDKIDINTTVDDFKKNIDLNVGYSIDVNYKTIDGKNLLYTGSKTKIYNNNNLIIEYTNIIRGEVTGDGKINYLDYVNVYNHIQKVKHPESTKKELINEYLISADMSGDGKVNYLDYVKIYNKIKELKGGN